jgi:transcription elongation factor GreA
MAQNEIILTPEGRLKLEEELAWREGEHAKEITESIKTAKDFGDLSENAEYDAAKEEQARNEARINEIRKMLANSRVVENISDSSVSIGSTVTILDVASGKQATYTIVGTTETDSLKNRISNESPVGSALMGHKKGDDVEVVAPNGTRRTYQVVEISR